MHSLGPKKIVQKRDSIISQTIDNDTLSGAVSAKTSSTQFRHRRLKSSTVGESKLTGVKKRKLLEDKLKAQEISMKVQIGATLLSL